MIAPREFDLGDLVNIFGEFKNRVGDFIEPATVTVKVKAPDGTVTTKVYGTDTEVVRDDVGKYHMGVDANQSGWWYYRFTSTLASQAAAERSFRVKKSQF